MTALARVVKALEDSGLFSEVEVENVVGIGVADGVFCYDDENGVAISIKVKAA